MAGVPPAQQGWGGGYGASGTPSYLTNVPSINTSALVKQILAAMQPGFKQQDMALRAQLAGSGIVGGGTPGAFGALANQQNQQAEAGAAPYIFGADQANQNTALQGGEFDVSQHNNMLQFLMGLKNQDWLGQLGAASGLSGQELQQGTNAFQSIYQQPGQFQGYSGLSGLFGSGGAPPGYSYGSGAPSGYGNFGGDGGGGYAG